MSVFGGTDGVGAEMAGFGPVGLPVTEVDVMVALVSEGAVAVTPLGCFLASPAPLRGWVSW